MKIIVFGAGYVGLVSAVCLAKTGHKVHCVDVNEQRVAALSRGECPIYEAHLPELLCEQVYNKQLTFSCHWEADAEIYFIAVGTPGLKEGTPDLTQVFALAAQIAKRATQDAVIVIKSTVPTGTGDAVDDCIRQELAQRAASIRLSVVSNPEFLREGRAVEDFLQADRIIVGGDDASFTVLRKLYQPLLAKGTPLLTMDRRSAELSKYAANAMLACRISFINQISQLAEKTGANIDAVRQAIGSDPRIGDQFLQAGIGYGGSCFPKDVRALIASAQNYGLDTALLDAIEGVNNWQKTWVFRQLEQHFGGQLAGVTVGVWGLAFKPETDDLREASSLEAINALLVAGVRLRVYDPVAMPAAKKMYSLTDSITWCENAEQVLCDELSALVIVTEWQEFKHFPLPVLREKLAPDAIVVDGRHCLNLAAVKAIGLPAYYSVGRPVITNSQLREQVVYVS